MLHKKYFTWVLYVALVCCSGTVVGEPLVELPAVPLTDAAGGEPAVLTPQQIEPQLRSPGLLLDWRILAVLLVAAGGLFALRRFSVPKVSSLPPDVFEVLGSGSIGSSHPVRVIRFGPKTLLVSVSSAGCKTLSEIADVEATACIVQACKGGKPAPLRTRSQTSSAAALLMGVAMLMSSAASADDTGTPAGESVVVAVESVPAAEQAESTPPDHGSTSEIKEQTSLEGLVNLVVGTRSLDTVLSAALMFGVVSLAPAVLLMTTCFVRMSVVLALIRQGLGTVQLPSNQIVTSLALFLSAMVMWPVWSAAYRDGVKPYQDGTITLQSAYDRGSMPIRRWMAAQIEQAGNRETMLLFLQRHPTASQAPATYDEIPLETLLPAFLVSELEVAFTIGFRMLLPFLVLDVLVATLVVSTGLVMLPPTVVSLPFKLLVFVMADGWSLVVQSLLDSIWPMAS